MQQIPIPPDLQRLADPPRQLFLRGQLTDWQDLLQRPRLAVVGARAATAYGQMVTRQLIEAVAARGIVIVSGLAYGIDGWAHQAALAAGGRTLAVLPGGISRVYPRGHLSLARDILKKQGVLLSEHRGKAEPHKYNFVGRNRLIAGLANAVLVIEAGSKSGSLHTAQFALEAGIDVLAVPGDITSSFSAGSNRLIRDGALPITCLEDLLARFGFDQPSTNQQTVTSDNPAEQRILELIQGGVTNRAQLGTVSGLDPALFSQTFTLLEMRQLIKTDDNQNFWVASAERREQA